MPILFLFLFISFLEDLLSRGNHGRTTIGLFLTVLHSVDLDEEAVLSLHGSAVLKFEEARLLTESDDQVPSQSAVKERNEDVARYEYEEAGEDRYEAEGLLPVLHRVEVSVDTVLEA